MESGNSGTKPRVDIHIWYMDMFMSSRMEFRRVLFLSPISLKEKYYYTNRF